MTFSLDQPQCIDGLQFLNSKQIIHYVVELRVSLE